jgi:RHS repeat-associated protein
MHFLPVRRRPSRTRVIAAGLVPILAVSSLTGAAPAQASASTKAPGKAEYVTERPDMVSAGLAARLENRPILVQSESAKDSKTWINPDGTLSTNVYAGPIQVQRGGRWTPIDTSLVVQGNRLVPKAADADVTISADGSGPLARIADDTKANGKTRHRDFAIKWAGTLGKPEVSGNTATWRNVAPGADLIVQAQPEGFVHFVVFHQRPTSPVEIHLPVELAGMKLGKRKDHGLELTDDTTGKALAAGPPPQMWDAAADQSPDAGKRAEVTSQIVNGKNGPELVLKPDAAFLSDPAVQYPVTVDPWMQMTLHTDTFVSTDYTNSQTGATWLHAGRFGTGTKTARTYLQFDLGGMVRKHILNSDLTLSNYKSNACGTAAGAGIQARQVTSAWVPSTLTLANQPTTTATGAVTSTKAFGFTGCTAESDMLWSIEPTLQAWSDGTAGNYGVQLRAVNETEATDWRMFRSAENTVGVHPPQLTVQWNSYPTVPTSLALTPSAGGTNGGVFATSLTPTLQGLVGDGEWDTERIDFEIDHDPAYPAEGTGVVWTGSAGGLQQGQLGKIQVPAGYLADGKHYQWKARGFDGTDYSRSWSSLRTFTTDITDPVAPSVAVTSYPANAWSAKQTAPVTATLATTSADGSGYYWGLDDPSTPNLAAENAGGGDPLTISLDPKQGWHTLYVKTRDMALRTSTVTAYSFGAGVGEVTKPLEGDRTQAAVTLASRAAPDRTGVRYEYKADMSATGTWAAIPTADVTVPGAPAPIASWPQTRTDTTQPFGDLYWDVAKTMAAAARGDGPVQLRACFVAGTAENCSDPVTITLERTAFGASYATQALGPGTASLLTGDYSVSSTDVSVFGLIASRSHTTLSPVPQTGASGVFGRGWTASFPAGGSSVSGMELEDHSSAGYVLFTGPEGQTLTYIVQPDGSFRGLSDAADGTKVVKNSATQFTHSDAFGVSTIFTYANGAWSVSKIDEAGADDTTTYSYDSAGRVTRMLAPVPHGVDCSSGLLAGCKALEVSYASATTATDVSSGWGDFNGLVKQISYIAYDPASATMKSTVVAAYAYDSASHLRQVTDPRSGLTTTYYYNGEGKISQITQPGLMPWTMAYDTSGRIAHVSRTSPQGELTQAVAYGVPIGGASAPVDLTGATTAAWGQSLDLPRTGAAVFPANRVPTRDSTGAYAPSAADWPFAALTYVDVNGRAVNTGSYGAGAWQVSATSYDDAGKIIWDLSPSNRAQALTPTSSTDSYVAGRSTSAERAQLLATVTVFDNDGNVLTQQGPTHQAVLASGKVVSARALTSNIYDEGTPNSARYDLVTTTSSSPLIVDGIAAAGTADIRSVKLGYDPIVPGDTSGWDLRQATSHTTVMGSGSNLSRKVRYDAAGSAFESWMPSSTGADSGTTVTVYYTAGTNSSVSACGNKPEWAGLVCQTGPKVQPSGATMPVKTTSYGYYGQVTLVSESSGSAIRATAVNYDTAGRISGTQVSVNSGGGTAVPDTTFTYDAATGLQTQATANGVSVTTSYDTLGRTVSVTDADGSLSTTSYDAYGHVASINDGKGTYTYTYDGTDAAGKAEHRGLVTTVDTGAGAFTGAYDAEAKLIIQTLPGGLTASSVFDNVGKQTGLTYTKSGTTWLAFTATSDVEGRTAQQSGPQGGNQAFTYDGAGRLTQVADSYNATCTTRVYGFDADTNRTSLASYPAADDGTCSTSTTASTATHGYDAADRITDAGYGYDALGRTSTVPAADVSGGSALTVGYYTNDVVATLAQGTSTRTFTLDPLGRTRSMTSSAGTMTNHYASSADSPAWISEANGAWSRSVTGLAGLGAVQASDGTVTLQLANLHGDVVATCGTSSTGVASYFEQTEYGVPRTDNITNPTRYGWLGSAQRSIDSLAGLVLMGVRLYNPAVGRFLQVDPILGGNANDYEYCNADPINCKDLDGRDGIITRAFQGTQCFFAIGYQRCKVVQRLADDATSVVQSWYGYGSRSDGTWRNAFLHCLWNALMTVVMNRYVAAEAGDIHETFVSKSGIWSTMDYHNNWVGRELGTRFLRIIGAKTFSKWDLARYIIKNMRRWYYWECTNGRKLWKC